MGEWTVCANWWGLKRGWQPPNFHGGGGEEGKGFPGGRLCMLRAYLICRSP